MDKRMGKTDKKRIGEAFAKKTKMANEPRVGDAYFPLLAGDYRGCTPHTIPGGRLTIVEVEPYGDNEMTCCVTAVDDDGVPMGYDCMWSNQLQAWVYCSEGEE